MDAKSPPSAHRKKARSAPLAKSIPRLRDIALSPRCFWKDDLQAYLIQKVRDRTYDSTNDRDLPSNEIDCLALNEIAVAEGQGFFLFLPNRSSWSHQTSEPKSRGPSLGSIKSSIPSLIFMRYTWSDQGRTKYFATPHRSRYLACDFQLNPPPMLTPLYCIQVVSGPRYPVFNTEHTSFIVIRANPLGFGSMADLAPIIGPPPRKRKGSGAEDRLGQVEGCWDGSTNAKYQRFAHANLTELYASIVRACHPAMNPSSMTSGDLTQLLPRPLHPDIGIALGQDPVLSSIPTRLGGRLTRA
ncbi:hypothetical protein HBH98_172270 [Parastagonospora nodorum]|nr:hypothetical protein HBH52_180480 [Parastagonospora nodorum]KAH3991286.1 hypothetical protein HBI10_235580 [Parastagonospora nodorum]KAH4008862.1 hypothetical protein HBI13_227270 [Parastagonospora nodorum]KAH4101126.1 hypothetical protein HBH46_143160 [Parastagonospora nodorum]KAH4163698.1 hypothetical protein HBH43_153970 [Parastagonospora nodorum]